MLSPKFFIYVQHIIAIWAHETAFTLKLESLFSETLSYS